MKKPTTTNQQWNIKEADNCVRAVISKRHDINYYFTSLEIYAPELGDGIWKHVDGSAAGHSANKASGLARVERLLGGEWKFFIRGSKESK